MEVLLDKDIERGANRIEGPLASDEVAPALDNGNSAPNVLVPLILEILLASVVSDAPRWAHTSVIGCLVAAT